MTRFGLVCSFAALSIVSLSSPAQASHVYASPNGSGNACTAAAPCSLDTALLSAAEFISCIDGAQADAHDSIGGISRTIDCPGAILSPSGFPYFTLGGSSSQVVVLRNLTFYGGNAAPFIKVTGGTTLIIENCKFQNSLNSPGIAIQFQPNSPAAQLIIRDSVFANNGTASGSGGALQVVPAAGGSASVVLERVSFNLNVTAMALSGPVNVTMIDSTVSASRSTGILVGSGSTLEIKDSTLVYNVGSAVSVASGGTLRLSNNDIKGNQIGISNSGGQALTYANNRISGNGSSATLTAIQGGQ
jgi:hypothetical protein